MRIAMLLPRILLPRLGDMLFLGAFLAVVGLGSRLLNVDGDLGRHLTIGKYILESGTIPTRDLFSHTMTGQPLTPHEWLAQVLFAFAYRGMGLNGVVLLCAGVLAVAFWLAYRDSLRRSGMPLTALGLSLLAMSASSLHWLARPHIFTILLIPLWVILLEALRRGQRWPIWVCPLLMLVWANLHGAFIAGFVIWLAYAGGWVWERISGLRPQPDPLFRRLLLVAVLSAAASLINPSGLHLWATSLGYLGNQYLVGHTAEYFSPDFHQISTWPFLAMLLITFTLLGLLRGRIPAHGAFLITGWAAMALVSARNIPLFAMISAPILAEAAADWMRRTGPDHVAGMENRLAKMEDRLFGYIWPAAIVLLVTLGFQRGLTLDIAGSGNRFDARVFPVQAIDWLEQNPQSGRIFNYFPWGGYILYRQWPDQVVFIDGQTDFYGEGLTRQYEQVLTAAPGWETVMDQYEVEWAMLPPDTSIARVLDLNSDWEMVYEDDTTVIFQRLLK